MNDNRPGENPTPLRKVESWPHLVSREMLAAMAVVAILLIWSFFINAPLEEPADPNTTPNPAKAPWYFLGLQELLVYFDPWLAGVVLPLLIVVGLLVLPYVDNNIRDTGVYSFRRRKYVISGFLFGMLLWTVLIIIGVYFRGPGWAWYWPWEDQSLHKPLYEKAWSFNPLVGLAVLVGYFGIGYWLPQRLNRKLITGLGFWRYLVSVSLMLIMLLIPIKIVLRLLFGVKYILITPWFNL